MSSDVGVEFEDELSDLAFLLANYTDGTVNELSLDGSVGFWMLYEVTEVTDDTYVLDVRMAGMMSLDASVSVTADMDKAGTYDIFAIPEKEEMTVSVEVSIEAAIILNAEIVFEKETMAISSIAMDLKVTGAADINAQNIPQTEFDNGASTKTISYDDYDVNVDLLINLALEIQFEPALMIIDFSKMMGEQWTVQSDVTINGSLDGMLDINGLPDDMKDEMFSEEFVENTGFTDFPIKFEEIDNDDFPFKNGVLDEVTEEMEFEMMFEDGFIVNDELWGNIRVNKYVAVDSPFAIYYSQNVGFMAYFSMESSMIDDMVGYPVSSIMGNEMAMDAVDPDVAEGEINEIADFQGEVGGDSGLAGFFTDAPYLGLILIGVIVVVVVAAVMLMRKKK